MLSQFLPFPVLTTPRLLLRQLNLNDAEEVFALRSNEMVNQYIDRPKATSIEEAKAFIKKIVEGVNGNHNAFWAICLHDEPKMIGSICLWNFADDEKKAEIGYELLPRFQGKGIMREAFLEVIEFGFQTLQLNVIEAWTVLQNQPSIKLLERNYFTKDSEAETKIDRAVEGPNTVIYSLSKTDYLNRRL